VRAVGHANVVRAQRLTWAASRVDHWADKSRSLAPPGATLSRAESGRLVVSTLSACLCSELNSPPTTTTTTNWPPETAPSRETSLLAPTRCGQLRWFNNSTQLNSTQFHRLPFVSGAKRAIQLNQFRPGQVRPASSHTFAALVGPIGSPWRRAGRPAAGPSGSPYCTLVSAAKRRPSTGEGLVREPRRPRPLSQGPRFDHVPPAAPCKFANDRPLRRRSRPSELALLINYWLSNFAAKIKVLLFGPGKEEMRPSGLPAGRLCRGLPAHLAGAERNKRAELSRSQQRQQQQQQPRSQSQTQCIPSAPLIRLALGRASRPQWSAPEPTRRPHCKRASSSLSI